MLEDRELEPVAGVTPAIPELQAGAFLLGYTGENNRIRFECLRYDRI